MLKKWLWNRSLLNIASLCRAAGSTFPVFFVDMDYFDCCRNILNFSTKIFFPNIRKLTSINGANFFFF